MISEMSRGGFFSIEFVTADIERKRGGKLVAYDNAMRLSNDTPQITTQKKKAAGSSHKHVKQGNETITLHLPTEPKRQNRIRKVHLYLITKFNGKEVV